MTTEELLMLQVQTLSELEKQAFVERLVEHLFRNNQLHLIQNCYEIDDPEADELRDEISDLEEQIQKLELDKQLLEDSLEEERNKKETTKPLQS